MSVSLSVCVCVCLKSSPPTLLCLLQKDVVVSFPRPPVHFWGPFSGRQTGPKCKKNCSAGLEMRPFSGLHFGPPVAPKVASRRLVGLAARVPVSGARYRGFSVPWHTAFLSLQSSGSTRTTQEKLNQLSTCKKSPPCARSMARPSRTIFCHGPQRDNIPAAGGEAASVSRSADVG